MAIRFIHTSDWQLGMTRWFLPVDAQARYSDDQFQCIEELGRLADETGSQFIIVAGDIFDTLLPGSKIINRFIDSVGTPNHYLFETLSIQTFNFRIP